MLTAEAADKRRNMRRDIWFQIASSVVTLCLGLPAVVVTHGAGLPALPVVKMFVDQALGLIKVLLPKAWRDAEAAKELRMQVKNHVVNALRPQPKGQDICSNARQFLLGYQGMLDVLT